jgi:hypothetical protein
MKMTTEDYNQLEEAFVKNEEIVKAHYNHVRDHGTYKDLNVRVSRELLRFFLGADWIIEQYDKGLNDDHLTTASVKALKKVIKEG